MNVIIVNRFYYPDESATSRMVGSLATALAERGVAVRVVASDLHHDRPLREAARAVIDGVVVHRVSTTALGGTRIWHRVIDYATFHWRMAREIRRLAQVGDVVVAGTDPPLLSVTLMIALWRSGAVLVNWLFDLFPEAACELGVINPKRPFGRLLLQLRDLSLRHARWNVAPMRRMAELLESCGIAPGQMVVIKHWSDGKAISPIDPAENALRAEWGLTGQFVVGYSGNFGRVHEFGTILDTMERLRERADIVFLFVGDGHRRDWFIDEVRRRGLTNVVMKPLQPRDRLAESLSVADVHLISLLPNLETCSVPSKLYGILAAGRPALFVGDTDGEVAQTLRAAGCGSAVAIGASDALANHISQLAASPARCLAMSIAARKAFDANFSEAAGVENWHRLLMQIDRSRKATIAVARAEAPTCARQR